MFRRCLLILAAAACGGREPAEVGTIRAPAVLLLSPSHAAQAETSHLRALESALARHGATVHVRAAATEVGAIRDLGSGHADLALLNLFEYLLAHQEYAAEARLQVVRTGGATSYAGEILVGPRSGIRSLEELSGKRIAYSDPYSTSGFLLAAKALRDAGVKAAHVFAGSHARALEMLRAGEVDAAATYTGAAEGELRVIATTEKVPNEPLVVRRALPPEVKERLLAALLGAVAEPELAPVLKAIGGIQSFVPIRDGSYGPVFDLVHAAGSAVEDLVPSGWMVKLSRRPMDLTP